MSLVDTMRGLAHEAATHRLSGEIPEALKLDAEIEDLYAPNRVDGGNEDLLVDTEQDGRIAAVATTHRSTCEIGIRSGCERSTAYRAYRQ
jgi:hypothetical protein